MYDLAVPTTHWPCAVDTRTDQTVRATKARQRRRSTVVTKDEADYDPAGGIQVSKVWWDGEKLMAKPIPLEDIYQPVQEPVTTLFGSLPVYDTPPVRGPVAWKDLTYGNLHHQDFGNSIPLYPAPPADGYDKVLQAIKEARPAVAALKDKPVSWWLDRFEELVKQLKEKNI